MTRSQPGTTSLRALVYMDEVFGFFPPTANPPSKRPMLTLLKQARAHGVGLVLASQNPVDLDYKGLGNAGTWFIGRLQTDRDKLRVLEALDGAMAGSAAIPRTDLDRMISGLGKRVFLMHSVHRGGPTLFSTRWVMSYLAGPMTLSQIRALRGEGTTAAPLAAQSTAPSAPPQGGTVVASTPRPVLPPGIRQFLGPPTGKVDNLVYRPVVLAAAEVRYTQKRLDVDETRAMQVLVPLDAGPIPFAVDRAEVVDLPVQFLEADPIEGAGFTTLPAEGSQARNYDRWGKELVRWIQGNQPIMLYESRTHKLVSRPGESERDFRIRLAEMGREARDAEADRIRKRYEARARTLQDRMQRATQAVERKKGQSQQALVNTGVAALGGFLGAMLGGAKRSQIGRASTAARGAGRVVQSRQEAARAEESVDAVRTQIDDLERELQEELRKVDDFATGEEPLDEVAVRPTLNAITMRLVALVWVPGQ